MRRRGWLSDDELVRLIAASNLIPGPTSTELAMHVGYRRAGISGLLVAGLAFIVPAALVVAAVASAYVAFGARPETAVVLATIGPAVVAVLVVVAVDLARPGARNVAWLATAAAACIASLFGADEIVILLAAGVVGVAWRSGTTLRALAFAAPALAATTVLTPSLAGLAVAFLKIGAFLFGSGYVLVAFLRSDLVDGLGWLTERQLLDAVAVGQVTPGPLFTTATFVGWLLLGPAGALVATVAIFLPAFVFVIVSVRVLDRLEGSEPTAAFLRGVGAAAVGLIAAVAATLARSSLTGPLEIGIALAAGVLLLTRRAGPGTVVVLAAAAGFGRAAAGL